MKKFKRIFVSFILVFSIIFLVACGGEKTKTFYKTEIDGNEVTINVKYKDDTVNLLDFKAKTDFKAVNIENKEQAQFMFSMVKGILGNIEGIKFDVDIGDSYATIEVNLDFNKIDFEKLKTLAGSFGGQVSKNFSGELDEGIKKIRSFKELEKSLLEAEFKEK